MCTPVNWWTIYNKSLKLAHLLLWNASFNMIMMMILVQSKLQLAHSWKCWTSNRSTCCSHWQVCGHSSEWCVLFAAMCRWISVLSFSFLALSPENRPVDIFAWPCLILPRSKQILFVEGEATAGMSYIVSLYLGVVESKQWCFRDVEVEHFSATATHTHTYVHTHCLLLSFSVLIFSLLVLFHSLSSSISLSLLGGVSTFASPWQSHSIRRNSLRLSSAFPSFSSLGFP